MIEKILERLSAESEKWLDVWNDASKEGIIDNYADGMNDAFDEAISIVQEVAKEYGEKKLYSIDLDGCDDYTHFEMELTTQEYGLLERVSKLANETSTYGCMPRMYVTEIAPYQKGE